MSAIAEVKPIPGCEGYFASDDGRIFDTNQRERRQYNSKRGYMAASLKVAGRWRIMLVHRLVLLAFAGQPPSSRFETRHINGDPSDNRIENLKWGSRYQQSKDRERHRRTRRGHRHYKAKLIYFDRAAIVRRRQGGETLKSIADTLGLSITSVHRLCAERR